MTRSLPTPRWALATLSGCINGAAFVWLGPLALVANVPLLVALRDEERAPQTAGLGALVGFLGGVHIYGILDYGWLLFWGFAFYTASQMVLYALLFRALWRRAGPWADLALPAVAWTLTEWIRTIGPLSMPASYVGCIADTPALAPLLSWAPITGGLGVSTLVALAQSAIFHVLFGDRRQRRAAGAAFGLLGILFAGGALWPPGTDGRAASVVGVQGGLPNYRYAVAQHDPRAMREVVDTYAALSAEAYAASPDLVVWPETAVRAPILDYPELRDRLVPPSDTASLLVAGLPVRHPDGVRRNEAVAIGPGGTVIDRYAKVRLVPGHEAIYTAGADWVPLETPLGRLGVMICLESVYPDAARALARAGAEVLLVISNDAGFRRTPIARHMTQRAIVRAVETGRWLVRVGQAGISAVIDPTGRVHARLDLFVAGLLRGTVQLRSETTPYVRLGDWWVLVTLAVLLAIVAAARARSRRGTRTPA